MYVASITLHEVTRKTTTTTKKKITKRRPQTQKIKMKRIKVMVALFSNFHARECFWSFRVAMQC